MIWNSCLAISVLLFAASLMYALFRTQKIKKDSYITPFNLIFAGAFIAIFVSQIPLFVSFFSSETSRCLKVAAADFLQTIQVFTLNVGAADIIESIADADFPLSGVYSSYVTVIFFIAPVLTFGFILSFIKSAASSFRYNLHYTDDVCIFSELNEKSAALAESIKKNRKKTLIVFSGVDSGSDSENKEYIELASGMNAVLFKKDIVSADFSRHSKKSKMDFFVMNGNGDVNVPCALSILDKYSDRDNTGLYVFSAEPDNEIILANAEKGKIKLRRINEISSVVYNYLYENGNEIFASARENDGNKEINAVILGLGAYGTEMLKSLSWFGQMDGYKLRVDAFDINENAESKFKALCPELMSGKINGAFRDGEGQYDIRIHSGIDVTCDEFSEEFSPLPETTFVFVCLGNDTDNISQAVNIRMLCERKGADPVIKTVVYSESKKAALEAAKNYRGQAYNISVIGDMKSTYSEKIIVGTELEKQALERHLKWGSEEDFWLYEYNYRSSTAAAIHLKARIECKAQPQSDKFSEEKKLKLEKLEHRRWSTYMRSEGYVYSGSTDKSSRNDLAKQHHNLVAYDLLNDSDKRKDSTVGS